jgi:hypothetical protein
MLIVRDMRVSGFTPRGNQVLEVDQYVPLASIVAWILGKAIHYNSSYVWLKIIAHGFTTPQAGLATGYSSPTVTEYSQGGMGIQLGQEAITLQTVSKFRHLFEWLDWTDIRSCGAAYITPGYEGRIGDGNILCSRLAQALGCPVRASTATQYDRLGNLNGTAWEGTVLTYGPKGNVINVENNPKT